MQRKLLLRTEAGLRLGTLAPSQQRDLKFYKERETGPIREMLEKEVIQWPGVTVRPMMGCLCYFRGKRFFAFLVTNGIVITKLSEEDRAELSKRPNTEPFKMAGKTAKSWVRIDLKHPSDLRPILPYVRKSYLAASIA